MGHASRLGKPCYAAATANKSIREHKRNDVWRLFQCPESPWVRRKEVLSNRIIFNNHRRERVCFGIKCRHEEAKSWTCWLSTFIYSHSKCKQMSENWRHICIVDEAPTLKEDQQRRRLSYVKAELSVLMLLWCWGQRVVFFCETTLCWLKTGPQTDVQLVWWLLLARLLPAALILQKISSGCVTSLLFFFLMQPQLLPCLSGSSAYLGGGIATCASYRDKARSQSAGLHHLWESGRCLFFQFRRRGSSSTWCTFSMLK